MSGLPADHLLRMKRVLLSLDGLSLGDAFGQRFFTTTADAIIESRALPKDPWGYTDDTVMALSIVEVLDNFGEISCNDLADGFARRYVKEPGRGYGGGAHRILMTIAQGEPWQEAAGRAFDGQGSMGNGGAMRSAPIGAYFYDDLDQIIEQSRRSAVVTHAHPDGQAGAIAVALAAAKAYEIGQNEAPINEAGRKKVLEYAADHTPEGPTLHGLLKALDIPFSYSVQTAVSALGNGTQVISSDTVPFSIWCAGRHLDNFEEAMWETVSGLGDRDTTCAIVGGIVAMSGCDIPRDWLDMREPLELSLSVP